MNAAEILSKASQSGVLVFLDGGRVSFRGDEKAVNAILPELRERKEAIRQFLENERLYQLEPFRLDAAPDTPATEHINNMAWEFMQADGMSYQEAIRVAAEICGKCDVANCEAAYESVRALWRRITGKITDTPHVSDIVAQWNKPFPNRQADTSI
ncbi:MAG: hypothetical protein NC211_00735 [Alistipes senegalensis]|nr:hypothetical protein [Oxalobacter formigenes]MCM1280352.1 hypothetical protein [Alistipes senegalensis]